jgi:acyl-CoA reductase-like NAD-dependent aldehyde dehydrogenase
MVMGSPSLARPCVTGSERGEVGAMLRTLVNPATGLAIESIADATPGEVGAKVAAAAKAGAEWGRALPSQRSLVLHRLAELVEQHADELARLEIEETGKPWTVMRDGELPFAVDNLRFFGAAARSLHAPRRASSARGTRRCCCVGRLASWPRSRRGTSRS